MPDPEVLTVRWLVRIRPGGSVADIEAQLHQITDPTATMIRWWPGEAGEVWAAFEGDPDEAVL